jgi:hydroxymethylglutaryl-CoA reductase (NADPH)
MQFINIPVKEVGPIKLTGFFEDLIFVPLATYETPLWPSVERVARISRNLENGIVVNFIEEKMTRSIILESSSTFELIKLKNELNENKHILQEEVLKTSKFAKLINMNFQIVANLIYIRFEFLTADASGHNMVTKASDHLINFIVNKFSNVKYVSISGNYCSDKKVSSVNSILGRGKNVTAEITISEELCIKYLKTTPEKIVNLNIKKNLLGSILAGSIHSANAHYANMMLAIYLATGQDAANIVEGSQGITYAKLNEDKSLYFSVNCSNVIVGTIGNGKNIDFVKNYLKKMNCLEDNLEYGYNSQKLATIIAATVLCGELSLMAAQTNAGELIKAHQTIERKMKK